MTSSVTVWTSTATAHAQSRVAQLIRGTRGADAAYDSLSIAGRSTSESTEMLSDAYNRLVNMTATDTTLHIVAVIPMYESEAATRIHTLYDACADIDHQISLHILGLAPAIRKIFEANATKITETETFEKNAELLRKLCRESKFSFSFTLIDDYAENGAPIGFTLESLSRYIALIQSALIADYYSILSPALLTAHQGENLSIGISSLTFNREEATRQMLGLGFLEALDSVGINNTAVDVQKAAREAEAILEGISERYPRLFENSIRPLYKDDGIDEGRVVAKAAEILDENIAALKNEILALLKDNSLSLPEKEAVMAMILGRDNESLRGMQYEHEGKLLDDACEQPIELYVEAFNRCCLHTTKSTLLPVRNDYEALKLYIFNSPFIRTENEKENEKAFNPIPFIKRLKQEIINTTAFIRDKQDEADALEKSVIQRKNADKIKRLWHKPSGERKNLPHKEAPLELKYQPPKGLKPKPSVDLRKYFSPVKNQMELGSCTSFAATAMYEAMMSRLSGHSEDMSPAFLYYYSNVLKGKPSGGSNFYEQIEVLQNIGICHESLYIYDSNNPTLKPSVNAEEDARKHQVIEARQIPLVDLPDKQETLKLNHQLITSALSEGYPVGISLKIYDNLGVDGAFVRHPDDSPQAKEDGWHAMVIAGYSEDNNLYIVRNSWGSEFGDEGYCYIPAAYIDDPEYLGFACIITSITDGADRADGDVPTMIADFAATESEIRLVAIRNAIAGMRVELKNSQNLYAEYYRYYQRLIMQLTMPRIQNEIRQAAEEEQLKHYINVDDRKRMLEDSFVSKVKQFKRSLLITISVIATITLILGITLFYTEDYTLFGTFAGFGIATLFAILGYKWWIKINRRRLQEELDQVAVYARQQQQKLIEMQIRFHVAGMWLYRFHNLSIEIGNVYDRLASYNSTLRGWQKHYSRTIDSHEAPEGQMFHTLDPSSLLPKFFMDNKSSIVKNVDLIRLFESYQVNPEELENSHNQLRETVTSVISSLIADFNIANFLLGDKFAYLNPVDIQQKMTELIAVGQPSFRNRAMNASLPVRILMTQIQPDRENQWIQRVTPLFPFRPNMLQYSDPTTMILLTIHHQGAESLQD
ncbi:MAG: C1 family peptidase [Bacteroides sp.]|nr:C1 family peptidase [Bacteroides sp.]